ncbi:MAG: type I 3-dehydroquinate dehydratase [Dehalococcoidia bacterium]|nr:type I 3-dehydroquinate dehydratase [Dehalococcoidia bacterium]
MRGRICGVIISGDEEAIRAASGSVDLFELRLDLVGPAWTEVVCLLTKPWIAVNRPRSEGGLWIGTEEERLAELRRAVLAGAAMVDIELATPELGRTVADFKKRAKCLVSYHNYAGTPPLARLKEIVAAEIGAKADICKVATTANALDDNAVIMELIKQFPETEMVALAMGEMGQVSRVLGPLAGGAFAYGALSHGAESAPGQPTVAQLARFYGALGA